MRPLDAIYGLLMASSHRRQQMYGRGLCTILARRLGDRTRPLLEEAPQLTGPAGYSVEWEGTSR